MIKKGNKMTIINRVITINVALLAMFTNLLAGHPQTDAMINSAKKEAGEITAQALKKMLDDEKDVIILDVREKEQRSEGEIYAEDTYAITRGNLEFEVLNKIKNRDAIIVTYCRSGGRGALAAQTLHKLGYRHAVNLKGGLKGWAKAGFPIETGLGVTHLSDEE